MSVMLRRGILSSLDMAGKQHLATVTGLAGETLFDVPRVKEFGFSSSPPAGAMAVIAALSGRSDNALVMGLDHGDYGPGALGVGHTALYDAYGNVVSLVQSKVRIVSVGDLEITVAGAVAINSASLMHNGVNISATHVHSGVTPGGSNTGAPS